MTRFDAPPPSPSFFGTTLRAAGALVAARFGMIAAAFVPTVLTLFAATSLVSGALVVPTALRQAFAASPLQVFMATTASRTEVEALGPKLTALPDVAAATWRPKDEALAALIAAGLPAPTDGRNPLPDVWIVTLRGDGLSFMTEAVAARDAIAALPAVDRVRFDDAWAASLDRVAANWSRFGVGSVVGAFVACGAALFCVNVLFGRTLRESTPPGERGGFVALLVVGVGSLVVSAAVDYATCASIVNGVAGGASAGAPGIALFLATHLGKTIAMVSSAALFLMVCGLGVGYHRDSSRP